MGIRFLATTLWLTSITPAFASIITVPHQFISKGKTVSFDIGKGYVAIRKTTLQSSQTMNLSAKATAGFDQLEVNIVSHKDLKSENQIVGYPIWFDQKNQAVGILTHEIVVRVKNRSALPAIRKQPGFADVMETKFKKNLYLAKFTSPMRALKAANSLYTMKTVVYAHPNFLIPKNWRGPADEPLFSHQWHLENSGQFGGTPGADAKLKTAWEISTGSDQVLLAVIDGGFEMNHPDLDGAWFTNDDEVPGNGIDDDGNGYVDDIHGWNFRKDNNDPADAPFSDHGTSVAGLAGGRENSTGMVGSCPNCTILPVTASWEAADDAAAFYYAGSHGADIITNSWGYSIGTPTTEVVEEAIQQVAAGGRDGRGTIILFAMNNIDQDDCVGNTPDISSLDSVVAVSAASDLDKKVSFSAWGDCMEYLSPSYESKRPGIATADLTGTRGYNNGRYSDELPDLDYTNSFGGTSAATPISAGVFGLILSVNPELSRDEALAMILSTADKVHPNLADYNRAGFSQKYGYGRINAGKAVRAAQVFRKYSSKSRALKSKQRNL